MLLTVTGTPEFPLAITVTGAPDASGTALASPGNATSANLCALINQDIGAAGDPSVPGVMLVNGTNSYTIVCEGSDQWNAADGFNFSYTELTGDFDVVVRVKGTTHTSDWSKAGLMVREPSTPAAATGPSSTTPTVPMASWLPIVPARAPALSSATAATPPPAPAAGWQVETNGMAPAYPNAWLRLQRTGTQLAAYSSTDGAELDPARLGRPDHRWRQDPVARDRLCRHQPVGPRQR